MARDLSEWPQPDDDELIALLRDLVRIPSFNPPGEEGALAEHVGAWLSEAGLEAQLQPVAGRRANVVARLRGDGTRPGLLLCAHLDTVPPGEIPWTCDPLLGDERDGRIYGRGSADTKAALAAMLMAARSLKRSGRALRGDLVVLATVDEETGGAGARAFLESGGMAGIGGAVIGEPTSLDLVIAHRGALWLEITTRGRPAHGAMPEQGVNAILPMAAILGALAERPFAHRPDPLLRPPTLNVGTIRGGVKTNMVPDVCQATVDLRTVPGQDHAAVLAEVRALAQAVAAGWPGLAVEVQAVNDKPPLATDADHPWIRLAVDTLTAVRGPAPSPRGAPYLTDGSLLAGSTHTPAIVCGPGRETMAHQVDEYVERAEVVLATRFYATLAARWLA